LSLVRPRLRDDSMEMGMPAGCIDSLARGLVKEVTDRWGWLRLRSCGGRATGFLVAFEGLDGSGVSTHSRLLVEVLRRVVVDGWYRVVYSKEPTGGPIGFLIWQILQGYLPEGFKRPDILAHLFVADRLYHLYEDSVTGSARGVVEAVAAGYIVVLDRYKYSSIAYQAAPLPGGRTLTIDYLEAINSLAPPPHILVYLDTPPEEAMKRIAAERGEIYLYETRERLAMVRDNYRQIIARLHKQPEWPRFNRGDLELPAWYEAVPRAECLYGAATWPAIVEVEETDKDNNTPRQLEETAREAVTRTIEEAIRRELLTTTTT